MAIAISIKKENSFFSRASATWIHGLGDSHKHIFSNQEQSEKPKNSGQLSQETIDRAFRNQQSRSQLAYKYPRRHDDPVKREIYRTPPCQHNFFPKLRESQGD
jgi:hypothetical protein